MRFLFSSFLVCAIISISFAQYNTPGTGVNFNTDSLVLHSQGAVTGSNGTYYFHDNINVSTLDTLRFDTNDSIYFDEDVLINIEGYININAPDSVIFTAHNTEAPFCGIRVDGSLDKNSADNGSIRNLYMSNGGGISCLYSNVVITDCKFINNSHNDYSEVVDIFFSHVHITHCDFIENAYAAISSPANSGSHVAIIDSCLIYHNVTSNQLQPQINLGPSESDTIKIRNNIIEGSPSSNQSGGIAIATMAGGEIHAVITGNIITNNSYGVFQYGNNITSLIQQNQISDNNINPDVMATGSGILVHGNETSNNAVIRNNYIYNNHWGVVTYTNAIVDLGTNENYGFNQIQNNGNNGEMYNFNNMTPNNINAIGNWWGTSNAQEIEDGITHQPDDVSHGLVTYYPWLDLTGNGSETKNKSTTVYPNPCTNKINVVFQNNEVRNLYIINPLGKTMYETNCSDSEIAINTKKFSEGYYVLQVESNGKSNFIGFVVE